MGTWWATSTGEPRLFLALTAYLLWTGITLVHTSALAVRRADQNANSWSTRAFFRVILILRNWLILPVAAATAIVLLIRLGTIPGTHDPLSHEMVHAALLGSLGLAALSQFFQHYFQLLARSYGSRALRHTVASLKALFWLAVILAGSFLLLQYAGFRAAPYVTYGTATLTGLLILEHIGQTIAYFFQPKRERRKRPLLSGSPILSSLFGGSASQTSTCPEGEPTLGRVRLADLWFATALKRTLTALLGVSALLFWLSTAVTVIPLDSQGVRTRFGKFMQPALPPGLHVGLPWPIDKVIHIPTERLQEIALGLEEDSGEPILWTEQHYIGEKNLLVGGGDELLTIAVPIHFRIKDPIAYLTHTANAEGALQQLAYRELLRQTVARDSFRIMTTDRRQVADALKAGLQQEVDRLALGLEICLVGLKDIHPPVDVAAAYQDVVSAEEDKQSLIHGAEEYRADVLTQANERQKVLRISADSVSAARQLVAQGEATAFVSQQAGYAHAPDIYQVRARMLAAEDSLKGTKKVIVDHHAAQAMPFYMDMRKVLNPNYAFPITEDRTGLIPTHDPTNGLNEDFDERRTPLQDPKEMFERLPDVIQKQLLRANRDDGKKLEEGEYSPPFED